MIRTQRAAKHAWLGSFARIVLAIVVLFTIVCFWTERPRWGNSSASPNAAAGALISHPATPDDAAVTAYGVQFLVDRVSRDPDDFVAQNKLASYFLQQMRETGNADFLARAERAAQASLASVPAERNVGALGALTQVEMAAHEFQKARDDAVRLTRIYPGKASSYGLLADALLELGEYGQADDAIRNMRKFGDGTAETEIRLGRRAFLQGDGEGARRHFFQALALTLNMASPVRETVAWCRWQLGDIAFSTGDYPAAEKHYHKALSTYPGYVQALASLARVRAAQGDLSAAIENYEAAVRRLPDPAFVAALGDLYHLAGQDKEANARYDLVEQIGHLSAVSGNRYNRQLTLFYADHARKVDEAYRDAAREYMERRDIYGADALAWAAFKAGKLAEARVAIKDALQLGTRDAKLFYHAGMIARASGDKTSGRDFLERALSLNPQFDLLQAAVARQALVD
ncbi:MAG: tetratricopeptide repeat protein [Bryobacteraceae bacterium]